MIRWQGFSHDLQVQLIVDNRAVRFQIEIVHIIYERLKEERIAHEPFIAIRGKESEWWEQGVDFRDFVYGTTTHGKLGTIQFQDTQMVTYLYPKAKISGLTQETRNMLLNRAFQVLSSRTPNRHAVEHEESAKMFVSCIP